MREGYRFTGADVSSLEFAIETSVQSDEEDEENVFPPGSINYVLDQIREMQSRSPLTPLPKTPARNRPQFPLLKCNRDHPSHHFPKTISIHFWLICQFNQFWHISQQWQKTVLCHIWLKRYMHSYRQLSILQMADKYMPLIAECCVCHY